MIKLGVGKGRQVICYSSFRARGVCALQTLVVLSQFIQDSWQWNGETALMVSCRNGHLETSKLLLYRGALVNHVVRVLHCYGIYS